MRSLLCSLVLAVALAFGCVSPARADIPAARYTVVSGTASTVIRNGPGIFYGVTSTVTQLTVVTCYDNTAPSGTIIYSNIPTLSTLLGAPPMGMLVVNGITCVIATSIVSPGYIVLWY